MNGDPVKEYIRRRKEELASRREEEDREQDPVREYIRQRRKTLSQPGPTRARAEVLETMSPSERATGGLRAAATGTMERPTTTPPHPTITPPRLPTSEAPVAPETPAPEPRAIQFSRPDTANILRNIATGVPVVEEAPAPPPAGQGRRRTAQDDRALDLATRDMPAEKPRTDGVGYVQQREEAGEYEGFLGGLTKAGDLAASSVVSGLAQVAGSGGSLAEIAGRTFGLEGLTEAGGGFRERSEEFAQRYRKPEDLEGDIMRDPSLLANPMWWISSVGEMAPSFAASIVPALGAARLIGMAGKAGKLAGVGVSAPASIQRMQVLGASAAGGAAGGTLEGTSTYQELIEKGVDHETATAAAGAMGTTTMLLNGFAVSRMLPGNITGKAIKPGKIPAVTRWLKVGGTESVTEYLEEPSEALIKNLAAPQFYDWEDAKNQLISGFNVAPAAFLMGLAGGGGNIRNLSPEQAERLSAAEENKIPFRQLREAETQARARLEGLGIDWKQATPGQRGAYQMEALVDMVGEERVEAAFPLARGYRDFANMGRATQIVEEAQARIRAGEDRATVMEEAQAKWEAWEAEGEVVDTSMPEAPTEAEAEEKAAPGIAPERQPWTRRILDWVDPSRREELTEAERRHQEELREAYRDPLTGLANPSAFGRARGRLDADGDRQWLMFDITNFKAINDNLSMKRGDERLKEIADIVREEAEVRGVDPRDIFRAGGDEFALSHTDPEVLDEIRSAVEERVPQLQIGQFTSGVRGGIGNTFDEADRAAAARKAEETGPRYRDRKVREEEAGPDTGNEPPEEGATESVEAPPVTPVTQRKVQAGIYEFDSPVGTFRVEKAGNQWVVFQPGQNRPDDGYSTLKEARANIQGQVDETVATEAEPTPETPPQEPVEAPEAAPEVTEEEAPAPEVEEAPAATEEVSAPEAGPQYNPRLWYVLDMDEGVLHSAPTKKAALEWAAQTAGDASPTTTKSGNIYEYSGGQRTGYIGKGSALVEDGFGWAFTPETEAGTEAEGKIGPEAEVETEPGVAPPAATPAPTPAGVPSREEAEEIARSMWDRPTSTHLRDRFMAGYDAALEGRERKKGQGPTDPWIQGYDLANPALPEVDALEGFEAIGAGAFLQEQGHARYLLGHPDGGVMDTGSREGVWGEIRDRSLEYIPGERIDLEGGGSAVMTSDGQVFYGRSHAEARQKAVSQGVDEALLPTQPLDPGFGFRTTERPFVTRQEGAQIAQEAGQIHTNTPGKLPVDANTGRVLAVTTEHLSDDLQPGQAVPTMAEFRERKRAQNRQRVAAKALDEEGAILYDPATQSAVSWNVDTRVVPVGDTDTHEYGSGGTLLGNVGYVLRSESAPHARWASLVEAYQSNPGALLRMVRTADGQYQVTLVRRPRAGETGETVRSGGVRRVRTTGAAPDRIFANIEVKSFNDERLARFAELPEADQRRLLAKVIDRVLKPIARSEGVTAAVAEGMGSWFQEGDFSVNTAGQFMLPADTPSATVRAILARASIALKQSGYFAARPSDRNTGRWAVELDFQRPLTPEEYSNTIETISTLGEGFNGTTMLSLDPGAVEIVFDQGVTPEQVTRELAKIGEAFPGEAITVERYNVETEENFNANSFGQDFEAGAEKERVDREAGVAVEEVAQEIERLLPEEGTEEGIDFATVGTEARIAEELAEPVAPGVPRLDGEILSWHIGQHRIGTGRYGPVKDWFSLSPEQQADVLAEVEAALIDENGNDRIAEITNRAMGLTGDLAVRVIPEGDLNPVTNPSDPVVFDNLPSDQGIREEWMRRYMAFRGIALGTEAQASLRANPDGHLQGFFVPMTEAAFNRAALVIEGGTYDPVSGMATFVNYRERDAQEYQDKLSLVVPKGSSLQPYNFEGEYLGPSDYYATVGRDHQALREVARLVRDHLRPAIAGGVGVSERSNQVDRLTRVSVGLDALARAYRTPPPAGVTSGLEVKEANKKLAGMFQKALGSEEARTSTIYRRFRDVVQEMIPAMQRDLSLTQAQTDNWYEQAGRDQRDILTLIQPELANDADYVIATAIHSILSNGNEVNNETEIGTHVYEQFLLTGEISTVNPNAVIRGHWMGRRGEGKEQMARFVVGEPGTGVGGDPIILSSRWYTHEISMRRLQTLVDMVGKERAAEFLKGTHWKSKQNPVAYNAVELLGPKIGQYLLDKMGIENQGSTIDLWIGRLHDILAGNETISEEVSDEERDIMQEVFRRYAAEVGTTNPAAVQAISWYVVKYLYRINGTAEKASAYATLPSAAADFLAGRARRQKVNGVSFVAGAPKEGDTVRSIPTVGWNADDMFETLMRRMNTQEMEAALPDALAEAEAAALARGDKWRKTVEVPAFKREFRANFQGSWPVDLADNAALNGVPEAVREDLAADAIGGAQVLEAIEDAEEGAVVGEALRAHGGDLDYIADTVQKIRSDQGLPTPEERLRSMDQILDQRTKVSIIGKAVRGPKTLARLLNPFRNPRYEISHWLLLDDAGNVVFHAQTTAGFISDTVFDPKTAGQVAAVAKRTGATRLVIAHNHPSGDTQSSRADLDATKYVAEKLAPHGVSLDYHLIINHDNATILESRQSEQDLTLKETRLKIKPGEEIDWTNLSKGEIDLGVASNVANRVKNAPGPNSVNVVFTDALNRAVAMATYRVGEVNDPRKMRNWLPKRIQELGAHGVVVVTSNSNSRGSFSQVSEAMAEMQQEYDVDVIDVVDLRPGGQVAGTARREGVIFDRARRPSVKQMEAVAERSYDVDAEALEGFEAQGAGASQGYDPAETREGELPDPRVRSLSSPDVFERVTAALGIAEGNVEYTRSQIMQAIIAAQDPDVLAAMGQDLQDVPEGRGAYRAERWLRDVKGVEVKHQEEVVSPEETIGLLAQALQVPLVATGKKWTIQRRGAEGAYKPNTRIIRINEPGDIEVAMHEIGHHVHRLVYGLTKPKRGNLSIKDIPQEVRGELLKMAKGVSDESLAEGVAEFFRRFITNPEAAQKGAPRYHDHVMETLAEKHPEVLEALNEARGAVELWLTATDAARIRSRISSTPDARADEENPHRTKLDAFIEGVQNDLHYVNKRIDDRYQGEERKMERLTGKLIQLARGAGGAGNFMMNHGTYHWKTREVKGKSFKEIVEPIFKAGQRDNFTAYIVARRVAWLHQNEARKVREAAKKGQKYKAKEFPVDQGTAERTIEEFGSPQFEEAFDDLVTYNRHLLELLRDSGVLAEEDFNQIEKTGGMHVYVPFHRVQNAGRTGTGKESFLSRKVVKKLSGGGGDIIDPLESIIKNTYMFTDAAFKQRVSDSLLSLSEEQDTGDLLDLIQPANKVSKRKLEDIWEEVNRETGDALGDLPDSVKETMVKFFRPGDYFGTPNVISVIKDGKRVWFEVVDKDLYNAIAGAPPEAMNVVLQWLAKPSQWRRGGAILSPDFMIRNPVRDQYIAWIQSEYGFTPVVDWFRGIRSIIRQDDMYRKWMLSGGEYATMVGQDREGKQRALSDIAQKPVNNVIKTGFGLLQSLSALMENGTRLGEFANAYRYEMNRTGNDTEAMDRAAIASREITTDYALHGSKTLAIRSTATFWNAGLQGDARTLRAFKNPKTRRAATIKAILGITVPSMILAALNADDDEYWEIPQWQRDLFWIVKVNGIYIRLPKPFGLGQIFGSIPERVMEWQMRNDPQGFKETVANLLPHKGSALFGGIPDVAAIQPFLDNAMNWSRFLQRPIVSRSLERFEDPYQFTDNTSEFAKWAAKVFDYLGADKLPGNKWIGLTSPQKFENSFRGWTAGLGGYALQAGDAVLKPLTRPETHGEKPASTAADMPVIKAFIARNPTWGSESISDFYEHWNKVQRVHATYEGLKSDRRITEAGNYRRRHQQELREYKVLSSAAQTLAKFRSLNEAVSRGQMSPEQKRERMEHFGALATQRAAIALKTVKEMKNNE